LTDVLVVIRTDFGFPKLFWRASPQLACGWFDGRLVDSVHSAAPLQGDRVAVIEASDFAKLSALPQFVLYEFAPDFNLPE